MDGNRQDFTRGSIPKKLIGFMLPTLAALILQAMYGAVDLLIVGRFGTEVGLSGISTGAGVLNLITFPTAALCTGVTVLIGRYLGGKEEERISPLVGSSVAFFVVFAVLMSAVMFIFARPFAMLMNAPEEAVDVTVQYIRICGGGFIFVVFYNYISSIFRGLGDSRLPLLFVGIACVVNIIGDLLLVKVLRMNVAGAAIATIAAQAVSVFLSLFIIRRKKLPFSLRIGNIRLGSEIGSFLKIGTPLALQSFLTDLTFLAICAFVNAVGLDASSGYGIAQRLQSFVMLIPSAIMQSMAPFVAQNVGADREDRARKGMLCGMIIGVCIGIPVMLLAYFKGDMLASLFVNSELSNSEAVIARSAQYLKGFSGDAVVTCITFSFLGYFNGHSRSMFVMLQGLAQSFLIRLPMSYFMSRRCIADPAVSLAGIGLAAPAATIAGIIMCLIYYRVLRSSAGTVQIRR